MSKFCQINSDKYCQEIRPDQQSMKMQQDIVIWKLHTVEFILIPFHICINDKEMEGQEWEIKILLGRMDGPDFYVWINRSASGSFLKDLELQKL